MNGERMSVDDDAEGEYASGMYEISEVGEETAADILSEVEGKDIRMDGEYDQMQRELIRA